MMAGLVLRSYSIDSSHAVDGERSELDGDMPLIEPSIDAMRRSAMSRSESPAGRDNQSPNVAMISLASIGLALLDAGALPWVGFVWGLGSVFCLP